MAFRGFLIVYLESARAQQQTTCDVKWVQPYCDVNWVQLYSSGCVWACPPDKHSDWFSLFKWGSTSLE